MTEFWAGEPGKIITLSGWGGNPGAIRQIKAMCIKNLVVSGGGGGALRF